MAFQVGVTVLHAAKTPPPDASSGLARPLILQDAPRWPVQTADASPSPLLRDERQHSSQGEVRVGATGQHWEPRDDGWE